MLDLHGSRFEELFLHTIHTAEYDIHLHMCHRTPTVVPPNILFTTGSANSSRGCL